MSKTKAELEQLVDQQMENLKTVRAYLAPVVSPSHEGVSTADLAKLARDKIRGDGRAQSDQMWRQLAEALGVPDGMHTWSELLNLLSHILADASARPGAGEYNKAMQDRDNWKAQAQRLAAAREADQQRLHQLTVDHGESTKRERKLVDAVVRLSELVCGGCSRNEGY